MNIVRFSQDTIYKYKIGVQLIKFLLDMLAFVYKKQKKYSKNGKICLVFNYLM